jgi:N-acyl homoserine lactone hydrolase
MNRLLILSLCLLGCTFTPHPFASLPVKPSSPGTTTWEQALGGSVALTWEPVLSARWHVPREGLINLTHPEAQALAHDEMEIVLPVHVLTHPTRGTFIIDTGISQSLASGQGGALKFPLAGYLKDITPVESLRSILARQQQPLAGVFFTHLHPDHVLGLPDVPREVPLYTGPGEAAVSSFEGMFMRSSYGALFAGHAPTQELALAPSTGTVASAHDFFGDGSLWVLSVPGHTAGSLVFLARTTSGPVLFLGDTSHTRFGWEHSVEPGTYTKDQPANRLALQWLKAMAKTIPALTVMVGHEWEPAEGQLPQKP